MQNLWVIERAEPGDLLTLEQDSRRVAYVAKSGNRYTLVVDGKEGKQYDDIVGGAFVFDSPNTLHYLAANGNSSAFGYDILLVEEEIFRRTHGRPRNHLHNENRMLHNKDGGVVKSHVV